MATVVSAAGPGSGAVWREQGYAVVRRPDVGVGLLATDIVAGILGPGAKAVASRVDVATPGTLGGPWRAAVPGLRPAVAVWHALTAATLANGCPWLVPGSHAGAVGDHERDGAVPVVLEPGDVLVLDTRLRHRPGDNHGCQTRVVVVVDYAVFC